MRLYRLLIFLITSVKLFLANFKKASNFNTYRIGGHSSVVERLVANEKVEGSTPFARSKKVYERFKR